jgi:signal transduction histidine kinase
VLDTKLKNYKTNYVLTAVIFLLLVVISGGIYSVYPIIKDQSKNYKYNIYDEGNFLEKLNSSSYVLYYETLKSKDDNVSKPSDVLIEKGNSVSEANDKEYIRNSIDSFNHEFYGDQYRLDSNLKNLEYFVLNKSNNLEKERSKSSLKVLLGDNPDINSMEALNYKYDFYIVLDYNDKGELNITRVYGADKLNILAKLKNSETGVINGSDIKSIKNMTYVYAIPKELQYEDFISQYRAQGITNSYHRAADTFLIPAVIFIIILGLSIPYRFSREIAGFRKVSKIPTELWILILGFNVGFLFDESYSLMWATLESDLVKFAPLVLNSITIDILEGLINVGYFTFSLGIIFLTAVLLKHILSKGIIEYLKGNSIICKFLRSIGKAAKRVYSYASNIDLRSEEKKRIRLILGINFIILTVMSIFWFFGIIGAIIYTVVLFRIITKHYKDISSKYNKLFEVTRKIAEGNLDVNIEEDLGIFNGLKGELHNIQKGFKKAVDEEVKSQRMKTELITNVSHDLKTPLTSIITYVDLLKDESLSLEKRSEYLDTLDRKSQRLKDLIEDLFEVSKATSGNISLNIVDVDVVSLMKQTLLELDDKILKSSLVIRANYPEEKVILPLDSQRMFRVFENLIINITKYALEGSRVYIGIINAKDKVQIVLKNMAASEIDFNVDEIMERFVRGDKARNTEGSGLGLAIAKSFVELQGGKLHIVIDGDLFKVIVEFEK